MGCVPRDRLLVSSLAQFIFLFGYVCVKWCWSNPAFVGADLFAKRFLSIGMVPFAAKAAPTMATCIPILWERIYPRNVRL